MSRILMVTWDGGGNVPPLLNIGRELSGRGHEVTVLGHAAQRMRVEGAGLAFAPYTRARPYSRVAPYADLGVFLETFLDPGTGDDVRELAETWSPDAAVVDCLMLGSLQVAQECELPTIALVHSFWAHFGERFPQSPITELGAPHGRSPGRLWGRSEEVLVAADRTLDPVEQAPPPNVRWTGVAQPPAVAASRSDRSRVLLSLSTVWFPGQQESMQRILDGLAGLPIKVTATIDHSLDLEGLQVPSNVEVHGFVDHASLMPEVALVIGHGGHATTMYALAHDLPVLVIPQHPMLDQPLVGEVLERHGAGLVLDQHPAPEEIRAAVERLLQDDDVARAAAVIGARLRGQDGSGEAADRIEVAAGVGTAYAGPR